MLERLQDPSPFIFNRPCVDLHSASHSSWDTHTAIRDSNLDQMSCLLKIPLQRIGKLIEITTFDSAAGSQIGYLFLTKIRTSDAEKAQTANWLLIQIGHRMVTGVLQKLPSEDAKLSKGRATVRLQTQSAHEQTAELKIKRSDRSFS